MCHDAAVAEEIFQRAGVDVPQCGIICAAAHVQSTLLRWNREDWVAAWYLTYHGYDIGAPISEMVGTKGPRHIMRSAMACLYVSSGLQAGRTTPWHGKNLAAAHMLRHTILYPNRDQKLCLVFSV